MRRLEADGSRRTVIVLGTITVFIIL